MVHLVAYMYVHMVKFGLFKLDSDKPGVSQQFTFSY